MSEAKQRGVEGSLRSPPTQRRGVNRAVYDIPSKPPGRLSGSKLDSKINFSCRVKSVPEIPRCLLVSTDTPPPPGIWNHCVSENFWTWSLKDKDLYSKSSEIRTYGFSIGFWLLDP